jgi:anaerobic nitric oxide reductase flavorubredoxin
MEEVKGLKFTGKKAAAFGAYGWSGESPDILTEHMKNSGFDVTHEGLKVLWNPDDDARKECREYGRQIGTDWKT